MHRSTLGLAALAAGLLIGPNVASALPAVTTEATNLRAGPAFDFPVVDAIPGEVQVNVHGCVRGYRWCDVSWRDARGWVPGNELAYLERGRRVTIVEYGPRIRLPVVGFAVDSYWDRYYRGRSWYGERARWRTVWRDRDRDERRSGDRGRDRIEGKVDRREGRVESRTERRAVERTDRDMTRRDIDRDRRTTRENRPNREDRPNVRTGRGDGLERGGSRALSPGGPRQDMDRGSRRDASPGGGRAEPSMRSGGGDRGGDRGGMGRGGDGGGRGGPGQGDRRP